MTVIIITHKLYEVMAISDRVGVMRQGKLVGVEETKNVNEKMESRKPGVVSAVVCAGLLIWNIVSFSGVSSFLYFNF